MQIKRFVFNPFSENTYVVYDETLEAAIIDCGVWNVNEQKELAEFIEEKQLNVKLLLNTHMHLDHAFGLAFAYKTYGIKPQYNQTEEALLPRIQDQAKAFGIDIKDSDIPVERFLNEGDSVIFGNTTFKIILVPGHSPGSICFYSEENASLFGGDVIFRGSIGRTDLWGGDHQQLIRGIREKILTLPGGTAVYPGHGPVTTIEYEKNYNSHLNDWV